MIVTWGVKWKLFMIESSGISDLFMNRAQITRA